MYPGTVSNADLTLRPEDASGDNFDLIHLTAANLYILRPILKHNVLAPLLNAVRSHVETALWQGLATFYPESSKNVGKGTEDKQHAANDSDDECLPWLKDLRDINKSHRKEMHAVGEDTCRAPNDAIPQNEAGVVDQNVEGLKKRERT